MAATAAPGKYGQKMQPKPGRMTEHKPAISEVHILWITGGLGCDGDSVSITAASQPSIEDVVLGAIPGCPRSICTIRCSPTKSATSSWRRSTRPRAANSNQFRPGDGRLDPQREDQRRRLLGGLRLRPETGEPITIPDGSTAWRPRRWPWSTAGTCATYGGIHAMKGNPTGCMGVADYLGWDWKSKAGLPIVNVPGCPVQPDNFMETLLYLLRQLAGLAPMIPLDEAGRPNWLFEQDRPSRAATAPAITRRAISPRNTARPNAS